MIVVLLICVLVYLVSVVVSCLVIRLHRVFVGVVYDGGGDSDRRLEYGDIVFLVYVPVVNLFMCICLVIEVVFVGKFDMVHGLVKRMCGLID